MEKISPQLPENWAKENELCDSQHCCLKCFFLLALPLTILFALVPLSYVQAATESLFLHYHPVLTPGSPHFRSPCLHGALPLTVVLMLLTFLVDFAISRSFHSFCLHSFRPNLTSLLHNSFCCSFSTHLTSLPGKSQNFLFLLPANVKILRVPGGCAAPSSSDELSASLQPTLKWWSCIAWHQICRKAVESLLSLSSKGLF